MPRRPFRYRLENVPNTNPDPLPAIYGRNPPPFTPAQVRAIRAGDPRREFERVAIDNFREVNMSRTGFQDPRRRRSLENLPSISLRLSLLTDEERRVDSETRQ
jgi:hypothetical protein